MLEQSLETARLTDCGWVDVGYELGSSAGRGIDWLTFEDARASVVDDVRRIREHPLVPKRIPIYGYIYNVRTGRLEEVKEATQVGRGIGLVEVPFVEPEAEVCQADLLGVLVESGPPVTHAVFESEVAINVIDVMKPENA